jgi:hypothetical protein
MDSYPGRLGPMLQVAMFESDARPDERSVEAFAERAREAFTVKH